MFLLLFPGMVQATPLTDAYASLVGEGGYTNTIVAMSFLDPYTEVCWVGGAQQFDQHPAGGSTAGGNCPPGAVGFVMEQDVRPQETWAEARSTCIAQGMRLPQPFEWLLVCPDALTLGLNDTANAPTTQWISNQPVDSGAGGLTVSTAGSNPNCTVVSAIQIADGQNRAREFRCAR
ncbi:MAG: hypothetical protein H6735_06435 [Alphaproteobacteria bacterium]|nr:hypothetical protein [Alphaproteobacteria bacterium]